MPGCIAPGCTSGYKSNPQKVHFFTVPKDTDLRRKWQIALKRPNALIAKIQVVCENHFLSTEIIRTRQLLSPEGNVLGVSPYQRPRLATGAVPSLFPWTEVTQKENISDPICNTPEASELSKRCLDTQRQENITDSFHKTDHLNSIESLNFTTLSTSTMELPASWIRNNIIHDGKPLISFSFLTCQMTNGRYYTFNLKEVIVDSNLQLHTNVLEKPLTDSSYYNIKKSITSIEELEEYLRRINVLKICQGCKVSEIRDHEKCDTLYLDKRNVFRHKTCTLLCHSLQCNSCHDAQRALLRKRKRDEITLQDEKLGHKKDRRLSKLGASEKIYVNKLKHKLNRSLQQKRKLQLMTHKLRKYLKQCQNKMSITSADHVLSQLRSNAVAKNQCDVVTEILKASHCKKSSGRRYSENWLMLCMLLYMRSASGNLAIINTQCGFSSEFFESLSNFLSKKEEIHKHGLLLLDEISCRESVNVRSQTLTYIGLEDFGEEINRSVTMNDKANHALTLMFQPIYDTYTQSVAVFGSHGPVNGQVLSQLIIKAIILLEKSGVKIHGVITDGAATNRKFWSILGTSGRKDNCKNYFKHPCEADRKIFVFSDTPHLIKTIRNRLYNVGSLQMDPDKPVIKWQHFTDLYVKDSQFPGKLRMCPKINNEHLDLNSSSKMRVRLAVQIFSQSVANALRRYAINDPQLDCWESTAEFCSWINKMFDALNRHEIQGVLPNSEDFKIIELSLQKLNSWEENVNKKKIPAIAFLTTQTAEGLRVTLQSSLDIIKLLTEEYGFPAVPTGRINQDSLERFFGTVRQASGSNDHPTFPTFLQIYKILSIFNILKPPKTGNCSIISKEPLLTLSELKSIYSHKSPTETTQNIDKLKEKLKEAVKIDDWENYNYFEIIYDHGYDESETINYILYYATEVVVSRIYQNTTCEQCRNAIRDCSVDSSHDETDETVAFNIILNENFMHPNQNFYFFMKKVEEIFQKNCESPHVYENVLSEVISSNILKFPCSEHAGELLLSAITYYIRLRMQQYSSQINKKNEKNNQLKKKQAKFCST